MSDKIDSLKKFSKNISISHLYFGKNGLKSLDGLLEKFENFSSIDASKNAISSKESNLYIVEINTLDKNILKLVQNLSNRHHRSHIYIFSDISDNPVLLKFCLGIGVKNIFSTNVNDEILIKFLDRALKKVAIDKHTHNYTYLGEHIDKIFPVVIYLKNKITFANNAAKKFFNSENYHFIEKIIKKNIELYKLIEDKVSINKFIMLENGKKEFKEQLCSLFYDKEEQKTILNILINENILDDEIAKLTQNRFIFIEKLKDRLVQNDVDAKEMYITMISVDNGDKIKRNFSKLEYFNFLKNFILQIDKFKNCPEKIVEWSQDLFVIIYENLDFESMKSAMALMHHNLVKSQKKTKFTPIITTSFISIKGKELDGIIDFIDSVDKKDLILEEPFKDGYYEFKYLNDTLDEEEQIKHLLQSCINNSIPVKLLNIYKGLCVNTEAKVLKRSDDFFYLSCEKLQRYIISIDNETVIQSPTFPYDIRAMVKFIDIKKNQIVVDKFNFLKHSANSRQHTRVQPTVRIPITIKNSKFVRYGEMIDLSINAIAIKTKQEIDKSFIDTEVNLIFKLPNEKMEDGFSKIDVEAIIKMILPYDGDYYKIVTMIDESEGSNTEILRYVYQRQKELIIELKKAIKYG